MNFVIALVLGWLRASGTKDPIFQAIAHLYIGGLIGYSVACQRHRDYYLAIVVWLSILELVCFLQKAG